MVIVGGGAMGASVAWHLRQLGLEDVVLLERDTLGAGSTSRSAGGIRTQFSDELNIRIALRSIAEFERMDAIDFRRYGQRRPSRVSSPARTRAGTAEPARSKPSPTVRPARWRAWMPSAMTAMELNDPQKPTSPLLPVSVTTT